ncbi:MAG: SDR family NAD(P)-dependent oxidoreductase, partial [Rhizobiales bacterium]|nr:SDR family NAD(P)-dependent oxidoreductase [Hyphomicrobiales bacterium]
MSTPQLLAGRLALVTGAGQGNGRAIALGVAAHGADVVVTDIDTAAAQQTAADVSARGRRGWSYTLDVTDVDACVALAKSVTDDVGPVAILVN